MEQTLFMEHDMNHVTSTKQPPGLYLLFFTELWERYGFYTVQTLLVLFLTKAFLLTDHQAYGLFGAFGALIYATPVIGGYLADKFLGFRQAIFFGGVLFIVGYTGLALLDKTHWFHISLAFLICGNGFFKSCVSSLLGQLYEKNDIRRESGFTLFYMGINIGSFSASFFGAWIAAKYGWNYAFGMAAIGMALGMLTLTFGQTSLKDRGKAPCDETLNKKRLFGLSIKHFIYLTTIVFILAIGQLLKYPNIITWGIVLFSIITVCYLLYTTIKLDKQHLRRMIALIIMLLFSVAFWSLYYQTFTSTTLFIERVVNRDFLSTVIPTAMFQSINPVAIIILSPILSFIWLKLAKANKNPSTPLKFALGILFMAIGFLIMTFAVAITKQHTHIIWIWMIFVFGIQTLGELFLSPVGLAMITVLAPPRLVGMLMGVWFLTLGAATAIAGRIADFAAIPHGMTDSTQIAHVYSKVFLHFGLAGVALALLLMIMTPWIKKLAA